jgi:hypothetical protein
MSRSRDQMSRRTVARRVMDKAALLVCGLVVFGGVLGVVLFAEDYLGLDEDRVRFLLAALGFIGLVMYFGATLPGPRAYRRRRLFWPVLLIIAVAPVSLFFILLEAGFVPMPQRVYPYMIIGLLLVPALLAAFHSLLRALYRGHR